jgi:hypothetical protein
MSQIISTAEPFFFPGGPIGVLLVHGFTGSPKEMRWMGEYLAQDGFTVLGIRLPGMLPGLKISIAPAGRIGWRQWKMGTTCSREQLPACICADCRWEARSPCCLQRATRCEA